MSFGALTRLGLAGLGTFAAEFAGDPTSAFVKALATVAAGYLINRSNAVEDEDLEAVRHSKNHHLQIALAGAFRNALQEIKTQNHRDIFEAWDKLLDAALNDPTRLLAVVIPAEFDLILNATNPHLDPAGAFGEAKSLLSFWLAYQRAYDQHGTYPLNPPRETPLPADLLKTLEAKFPEAFQRAFAQLLVSNDHDYARRAFERRTLQTIDANTRHTHEIVKRMEKKLDGAAPAAPVKIRTFISKLPTVDPYVVGREKELAFLDQAWANPNTNVVQIIASGGTGKTALMDKWFRRHLGEATVFGWSFYSQGTSQDRQTSSDPFFAEALRFFEVNVDPTASAYAKAEALADKLRQEKVLLLLDGVEPLQDSSGDMKDQALKALLQELDTHNAGLVLCTTRVRLTDLPDDDERARSWDLDNLSPEAGLAYLRKLGVKGEDDELKQASKDYGHHALALTLLGHYLVDFCEADVRREVEIPMLMVDEVKQGGHARRVMAAYQRTFAGKPELDILKALGYFDRPAEPAALQLVMPHMPSLRYKAALKRLRELRLILDADDSTDLDCHPLIREHFAEYATPEGHARLYEHYQKQAPHQPDTLAEMTPLFYAIYHGCQAGRHQEAWQRVYRDRVRRSDDFYLTQKLGAFQSDLALLANFFTTSGNQPRWTQPIATISPAAQARTINMAAFDLCALGRLDDAVDPMRVGADVDFQREDWTNAAIACSNLSELLLTLGRVGEAISAAQESVDFADRSSGAFLQMATLAKLAAARHQAGDLTAAATLFAEVERLQVEFQPHYPILYSLRGYLYCDLLLAQGKVAEVRRRATETLMWAGEHRLLLDVALNHLSLARAGDPGDFIPAIAGLRRAGHLEFLPLGLLARGTQHDLDEVYKIATRSGMRLHLTDYHLKQAELDLSSGNQTKAREHTQKAADLIQATGYHRRDPDLARLRTQLDA